jgi:ABC-2 type transport system ATP-binding protein
MDEPTANLDPTARIEFYDFLRDFKSKGGTVFISSHDLFSLQSVADSVTILKDKKVAYSGPVILESNSSSYLVIVDDMMKLQHLLQNNNFTFELSDNNNKEILVELETQKKFNNFLTLIIRENLTIQRLEKNVQRLEDIYKNVVLKE